MKKKRTSGAAGGGDLKFSTAEWRDIYDALMDAANVHHSGPRADRIEALARKIREGLS